MEVLKQHYSGHSITVTTGCLTQVYQCGKYSGLVSPVHSNSGSETEDDKSEKAETGHRAVQFQQCPRPCRLEPVSKKLRALTPPVSHVLTDDEDEDDEEDDEEQDESLDTIHADRFRRCSLSSEDESDDDDSEVFYLE